MKIRITLILSVCVLSPLFAQGVHDLVRPNLDDLRAVAEEERKKELAEEERKREEEEAKRLEEEKRLAAIQAAKDDPMVDVEEVKLVDSDVDGQQEYVVPSGGTLGAIAAERYGSSQYFPLIEVWNGIAATKVYVGQKVQTPSVATIVKVKGEKVLSRYPDEVRAMVKLREDYLQIEKALRVQAKKGELSRELEEELTEMHAVAKKIHAGFLVKRPGVQEYAGSLLSQCKGLADQFAAMKQGDFGRNDSRITRVHTRMGYALAYAIEWGRDGFM